MPFEEGNQLGKKAKIFDAALRRAIAQDEGQKVRDAAEKLLEKAAAGEPWAIAYLADRLDGRAAQTVQHDATTSFVEAVSGLSSFMAKAVGQGETFDHAGVGEGGSVLPPALPPTAH